MENRSNRYSASNKKMSRKISAWWRRFCKKVSRYFTPERKKNILVVTLNLLAMLAVAFLVPYFTLKWIDDYTMHGDTREVPEVCGKTLAEAEKILAERGLGYVVVERKFVEGRKKNEVLEQRPRGPIKNGDGSMNVKRVKEGRRIALVVNTGERPKKNIPSVIEGCSYRQAEYRLKGDGFIVEKVDTIPGELDWVYGLKCQGQDLTNGMAIPSGSKLTIVIGGGEKKEESDTLVIDHSYYTDDF